MATPEVHKRLQDIIDGCQAVSQPIHIQTLTRGYKVEIGCTSFAFERLGDMIEALNLFLDDPHDAAAAFTEHMSELVGADTPPPEPAIDLRSPGGFAAVRANAVRVGYPDQTEPG